MPGAFHGYFAALRPDQVLHDREPQTGASEFARPRLIDAVEALEKAGKVLFRDADTGVVHIDENAIPRRKTSPERDGTALRRVLQRIVYQIHYDLVDRFAVAVCFGPLRSKL